MSYFIANLSLNLLVKELLSEIKSWGVSPNLEGPPSPYRPLCGCAHADHERMHALCSIHSRAHDKYRHVSASLTGCSEGAEYIDQARLEFVAWLASTGSAAACDIIHTPILRTVPSRY